MPDIPIEFTHIIISYRYASKSGKTQEWDVASKYGGNLGRIAWFGRWRKYAFFPWPETVFEEVCMREL